MQTSRIAVVSIVLLTASAAGALAGDRSTGGAVVPVIHEEMSRSLGDLIEQFEGLSSQVRDHFTRDRPRPIISIMLSHREELGLSSAQVQALERLRTEYQKEATRVEADIRVAEMDLGQLQSAEPVDMKAVESKIRQIEKRRGDLRLAQARTIENGRAQLSAEQRDKLRALLAQQDPLLRAFPTPTPPGGPSRL